MSLNLALRGNRKLIHPHTKKLHVQTSWVHLWITPTDVTLDALGESSDSKPFEDVFDKYSSWALQQKNYAQSPEAHISEIKQVVEQGQLDGFSFEFVSF